MSSTCPADVRARYHELLLGRHRASTCAAFASQADGYRTLSPHVIERAVFDRACAAAAIVTRALDVVARRLLDDQPLRRSLGFGPHFDRWVDLDRHVVDTSICARLDSFIGPDGVARFVENNSIEPRSSPVFHRIHRTLPIAQELAAELPVTFVVPYEGAVTAVADAQARRGKQGPPSIATQRRPPTPKPVESPWLPAVAAEQGWQLVALDLAAVSYRDGVLRVGDVAIDIVELDFGELVTDRAEMLPILQAVRDGAARFPFAVSRGLLADNKAAFEVLSAPEHAHMFDAETNQVLRSVIPWTRAISDRKTTYQDLEIDLLPYIAQNRERFTIKPCGGVAGGGVVLGWDCTDAQWQKALKVARVVQSVVQERVPHGEAETYYVLDPHGEIAENRCTADFDPFAWNASRVAGAMSRIASSGLHNAGAGASRAPVWVLEPG